MGIFQRYFRSFNINIHLLFNKSMQSSELHGYSLVYLATIGNRHLTQDVGAKGRDLLVEHLVLNERVCQSQ